MPTGPLILEPSPHPSSNTSPPSIAHLLTASCRPLSLPVAVYFATICFISSFAFPSPWNYPTKVTPGHPFAKSAESHFRVPRDVGLCSVWCCWRLPFLDRHSAYTGRFFCGFLCFFTQETAQARLPLQEESAREQNRLVPAQGTRKSRLPTGVRGVCRQEDPEPQDCLPRREDTARPVYDQR